MGQICNATQRNHPDSHEVLTLKSESILGWLWCHHNDTAYLVNTCVALTYKVMLRSDDNTAHAVTAYIYADIGICYQWCSTCEAIGNCKIPAGMIRYWSALIQLMPGYKSTRPSATLILSHCLLYHASLIRSGCSWGEYICDLKCMIKFGMSRVDSHESDYLWLSSELCPIKYAPC